MISPYPFTAYLSETGLDAATNGLIGGVVPGEAGEGFPVFAEPASASSLINRFGLQIDRGYLVMGEPEGLGAAKIGDVLDVPELGYSGVVRSVKPYGGLGEGFAHVEVATDWRSYGGG